jgi:uncharacterized protein GlcG (DUF336 family)
MSIITLDQANAIISAILKQARVQKLRPISVVIVEPGCIVKAFGKEDGSAMMRFEMAFGKAYASLALGRSSDLVRQRAEHRPMFMDYLMGASRGQIFPEGGGQLIRDGNGDVIGAVGVTGDTQEKDHELAAFGIHAAGLKTDGDCGDLGAQVRVTRD